MHLVISRACTLVNIVGFQDFDGVEFLECLKKLIRVDREWVPDSNRCSLYIRPAMIGSEVGYRYAHLHTHPHAHGELHIHTPRLQSSLYVIIISKPKQINNLILSCLPMVEKELVVALKTNQ